MRDFIKGCLGDCRSKWLLSRVGIAAGDSSNMFKTPEVYYAGLCGKIFHPFFTLTCARPLALVFWTTVQLFWKTLCGMQAKPYAPEAPPPQASSMGGRSPWGSICKVLHWFWVNLYGSASILDQFAGFEALYRKVFEGWSMSLLKDGVRDGVRDAGQGLYRTYIERYSNALRDPAEAVLCTELCNKESCMVISQWGSVYCYLT